MANCSICNKKFHFAKVFYFDKIVEDKNILAGRKWKTFEACKSCYDFYKDFDVYDIPFIE